MNPPSPPPTPLPPSPAHPILILIWDMCVITRAGSLHVSESFLLGIASDWGIGWTNGTGLDRTAFANPEDAERHGGVQFCRIDLYVERCMRAHRNDMENIFPFLFLGAIYSMTGPSYAVARLHFLVFFLGRVVHSIAYLLALKAPTRSFAYVIAQVPCVSMAIQILMEVASFA
ncbi:unnamed protein product [Leuciscus chuanchicus]